MEQRRLGARSANPKQKCTNALRTLMRTGMRNVQSDSIQSSRKPPFENDGFGNQSPLHVMDSLRRC